MTDRRFPLSARPGAAFIAALIAAAPAPVAAAQGPDAPAATGPDGPAESPDWPASPVGDAARQLIELVNGGGPPTAAMEPGVEGPPQVLFTDSLLEQIPLSQIAGWSDDRREFFGELELLGIKGQNQTRLAALLQGRDDGSGWLLQIEIEPTPPHRIAQWWIGPSAEATRVPDATSWADIEQLWDEFAQRQRLTYGISVLEIPVKAAFAGAARPLVRFGADERLNIGTAIRWFALEAAAAMVRNKELRWNEVTIVPDASRSLPVTEFGATEGEITAAIVDLVMRMSRDADNTACDGLIEIIGRDRVLAVLRARTGEDPRNTPLLSTMENYRLKVGLDGDVIEEYLSADEAAQAEMLNARVPGNEISMEMASMWRIPQHIDEIGWFVRPENLGQVLADLWLLKGDATMGPASQALTARAVMPHPDSAWASASFRAALDEPGVMTAYWLLQRQDARRFVVTLIINDPDSAIPIEPLDPLMLATLRYLAGMDAQPAPGATDAPQPEPAAAPR